MGVDFRDLPPDVQTEVERCAKAGRGHPDPAVAAAASEWAIRYRETHGWLGAIGSLVLDLGNGLLMGTANPTRSSRYPDLVLAHRLLAIPRR
ncbi:MAG TPA: hypothetical protein VE441_14835 [Mycobacterium sp.]|nr:hypothetical protein [Mycobacterium sp.]